MTALAHSGISQAAGLAAASWKFPKAAEPPCAWGLPGTWRTPELCCSLDVPDALGRRCWGSEWRSLVQAESCCGPHPRPQLMTVLHRYSQLGRGVSRWCAARGVSGECCDVTLCGHGGCPLCWSLEEGLSFAVCCLVPSAVPDGTDFAHGHEVQRPRRDSQAKRREYHLQLFASKAAPLVDREAALVSNGCWADWTSWLRCCGPTMDDVAGRVQQGQQLCWDNLQFYHAICCEHAPVIQREAGEHDALLRDAAQHERVAATRAAAAAPSQQLVAVALLAAGAGPAGGETDVVRQLSGVVRVIAVRTWRLFIALERIAAESISPWWLLLPDGPGAPEVDVEALHRLTQRLGDGLTQLVAMASGDVFVGDVRPLLLRSDCNWRSTGLVGQKGTSVNPCSSTISMDASLFFSIQDGLLVSGRLVQEVAALSSQTAKLRHNLCTETSINDMYRFACCIEKHFGITVTGLRHTFGVAPADLAATEGSPRPVTHRRCPELPAQKQVLALRLLFFLSLDTATEADCLGVRASWGSDVRLWAFSSGPLPICAAAGVPVLVLETGQFTRFRDGRSLHQGRPAAALIAAFASNSSTFAGVAEAADELPALRYEAALADWIVGFDSDTAYHTEALIEVLLRFPSPRLKPYIIGHVVDMWGRVYPSGGSGMALSRRAAEMLGHAFAEGRCSVATSSDGMFGDCAAALGIPMVDVPGFLSGDALRLPRQVMAALGPYAVSSHNSSGVGGHRARTSWLRRTSRCSPRRWQRSSSAWWIPVDGH